MSTLRPDLTTDHLLEAAAATNGAYGHALSSAGQQCVNQIDLAVARLTGTLPDTKANYSADRARIRESLLSALLYLEEALDDRECREDRAEDALNNLMIALDKITKTPAPTPAMKGGRAPLPDLSSIYAMSAGHGAPTATLQQINCLVASVCKSCEGTIKEGERCLWVRPNDKKVKSYLIHECCPSSKPSEAKAGGAPMPFTDRLPLPPARKP
jgi:hypothetical protein